MGAELLVTDDADAFKQVADDLGLPHQVCQRHVRRNTEPLVEELRSLAEEDSDGSLSALGVSAEQAVADLERVEGVGSGEATGTGAGVEDDAGAVFRGFA